MTRTAVAIRHIAFEDLGSFAAPLERAGYTVAYHDAVDGLDIDPLAPDLLIVLGGPVGAYEGDRYPWIDREIAILRQRLAADLPTMGICLGAQLIARALGAAVYPGDGYLGNGKEIGWAPVTLTNAGRAGPLRHLADVAVLHWHGDTFDLPDGCDRLASTARYANQAFARGDRVLALQFHFEAVAHRFEHWLLGHAHELAASGQDVHALRRDALAHGDRLESAAAAVVDTWVARLPG